MSRQVMTRVAIAGALLLLSSAARGQSVKSSIAESAYARALSLHERAVMLYSDPSRAVEAARLHLDEVRYRTSRDPEAVEALTMAGHLLNYANRPLEARRTMEKAAERALAIGDIVRATQAYINAAFLAQKTNNLAELQRLGRKALLLSEAPLLPTEYRARLRNQIMTNAALVELVR